MQLKTEDFTHGSLHLITEALGLAKNFNSTDITEFHFISKLWTILEYPIKSSNILSYSEYDALTNYWFDNLKFRTDEIEKSVLSGNCHRILSEAKTISKALEMSKVDPIHILFGTFKVDTKVSVMLRDYGFTPHNILKLDWVDTFDDGDEDSF